MIHDLIDELPASDNADADRFLYAGHDFDPEVGLARYYDPTVGRWINQEPVGYEASDTNLYRYVGNAPCNGSDPTVEWQHRVGQSEKHPIACG